MDFFQRFGGYTWAVLHGCITMPPNVTSIPAHHWAATTAVATSIAHKSEVASAKVPTGSIADWLARLQLPAKPKKPSTGLLFALPYNVLINMNAREIKEVFDEVYNVESAVISACGRSRRDGRVRGQRDGSRPRPGSFPVARKHVARGGRGRRVLLAGDPVCLQAGSHADQPE